MAIAQAPADTSRSGWIHYRLREMEPRDSEAYRQLMANSPDTGMISIQVVFKEDPYEMLMQRRIGQVVVVVEAPNGEVVGTGACDARPVWFEGKAVQAVHLHSLLVRPDYRQRGVATAVVQWRIQWAREHYGENVLIFAEIQQSNLGAFKAAAKWATGFGQPRESGFLPVFQRPPQPVPGVVVREAVDADYPSIVAGLREYNHDVNFTRYVTADRLHRNLEPIHGLVFRHRYVVLQNDEIVGGAVLSSHDPSVETRIIRATPFRKLIARLSGMIQSDDILNGGEVDGIWFKPGHADAAHYLINSLRYKARSDTTSLNFTISNPKSFEAVRVSHWMPHTIYSVAYWRPPQTIPYADSQSASQSTASGEDKDQH